MDCRVRRAYEFKITVTISSQQNCMVYVLPLVVGFFCIKCCSSFAFSVNEKRVSVGKVFFFILKDENLCIQLSCSVQPVCLYAYEERKTNQTLIWLLLLHKKNEQNGSKKAQTQNVCVWEKEWMWVKWGKKNRGRSETEIDDTKNKLKCNLVSMNFVRSSVEQHRQEQTNALIFN